MSMNKDTSNSAGASAEQLAMQAEKAREDDASVITLHMASYEMGLRDALRAPEKTKRYLDKCGPFMDEPGFAEASAVAKLKMDEAAAELARRATTPPAQGSDGHQAIVSAFWWLQGALDCKTFGWDGDQHEAATQTLIDARAALAAMPSLADAERRGMMRAAEIAEGKERFSYGIDVAVAIRTAAAALTEDLKGGDALSIDRCSETLNGSVSFNGGVGGPHPDTALPEAAPAEPSQDAQGWRPIETAPKDQNRRVFALIPNVGPDWVRWAPWEEDGVATDDWTWWYEEDCPVKPTHWFDIPPAPEPRP